ncbi:MAG: hypothetical protein ACJ748_10775, partial [Flavisolibacter sp.]
GSSWGWATWNDKWKDFNKDSKDLLQQIKQSGRQNEFDFGNYPYVKMLEDNVKGLNDSWAIRFYASMFLKNGSFLFPKNTLIQNIGFDNSGVHCDTDQIFNLDLLEYDFNINEIPSTINKENIKSVKKYLSYNLRLSERKAGIKNIINKIIQKFSNKKPVQFSNL